MHCVLLAHLYCPSGQGSGAGCLPVVYVQFHSSDQSPQSFSRSQLYDLAMHLAFWHENSLGEHVRYLPLHSGPSSEPSPQSLSWSHVQLRWMQRPLPQVNCSAVQVLRCVQLSAVEFSSAPSTQSGSPSHTHFFGMHCALPSCHC